MQRQQEQKFLSRSSDSFYHVLQRHNESEDNGAVGVYGVNFLSRSSVLELKEIGSIKTFHPIFETIVHYHDLLILVPSQNEEIGFFTLILIYTCCYCSIKLRARLWYIIIIRVCIITLQAVCGAELRRNKWWTALPC